MIRRKTTAHCKGPGIAAAVSAVLALPFGFASLPLSHVYAAPTLTAAADEDLAVGTSQGRWVVRPKVVEPSAPHGLDDQPKARPSASGDTQVDAKGKVLTPPSVKPAAASKPSAADAPAAAPRGAKASGKSGAGTTKGGDRQPGKGGPLNRLPDLGKSSQPVNLGPAGSLAHPNGTLVQTPSAPGPAAESSLRSEVKNWSRQGTSSNPVPFRSHADFNYPAVPKVDGPYAPVPPTGGGTTATRTPPNPISPTERQQIRDSVRSASPRPGKAPEPAPKPAAR